MVRAMSALKSAQVLPDGSAIRYIEIVGRGPGRVFVHGLGASSAPYYAAAVSHPALAGHRSLLLDMLGFGISDRPADFAYTLEDHADVLATAVTAVADGQEVDLIGHSMGGAVAIVLARRHPHLVRRLVLVDANLDPVPPHLSGSGIGRYTEQQFLDTGRAETLDRVGPLWAATMRLAGPVALYRSAIHLYAGTRPTMRAMLGQLTIPWTFLYPEPEQAPLSSGDVVAVPDTGHNIMLDNTDVFARETARALS
jgi:pimeloyl-ACP methyl ester carboxylesterase